MTLNDLSTPPPGPLTDAELSSLETEGWTRYEVVLRGAQALYRFPFDANDFYHWEGDALWGNVTPQALPLDIVHVIFWKDSGGRRITQPISVEPTAQELKDIARRREVLRKYHAAER